MPVVFLIPSANCCLIGDKQGKKEKGLKITTKAFFCMGGTLMKFYLPAVKLLVKVITACWYFHRHSKKYLVTSTLQLNRLLPVIISYISMKA